MIKFGIKLRYEQNNWIYSQKKRGVLDYLTDKFIILELLIKSSHSNITDYENYVICETEVTFIFRISLFPTVR